MRPIRHAIAACLRSARSPAWKALALAWALAACALAASPQITAVRFWSLGEVTRVAIETTSEAQYHAERIDRPDRLFLDLAGVQRQAGTRGLQVIPVGDKLVKQIRVALVETGTARVVIDLAAPADYSISQITNPDRIMIELRLSGHGPAMPPARSVTGSHTLMEPAPAEAEPAQSEPSRLGPPPEKPKPTPPAPAARPTPAAPVARPTAPTPVVRPTPLPLVARSTPLPPAAQPTPQPPVRIAPLPATSEAPPSRRADPPLAAKLEPAGTKAESPTVPPVVRPPTAAETALAAKRDSRGDRSLIRALGLKLDRVVIDPGHGGHDTGTIGPTGLMEKDLVLDVAKRLGALIAQRLGSEVVYTREDDTFIPLEERTYIANDKKADLFLSIHANSSQLPRIAGSETFYLNFSTTPDAIEVAARENATSQTSIHELQTLVQKIALNEKVQESRELAIVVQRALYGNLPRNRSYKNRGIKKAPFVVLIGAQMPSVLAEIAFLSNPKDEGLLKRPEYRQKVAEALFRGVSQYADALSHLQVARQRRPDSQTQ
jgi:N-acetylmuramoyl-L-alanine amidase